MIKSNSCYTQYLLKMGTSQAAQYNTVLQFSRAQNQYHVLERLFTEQIFSYFFLLLSLPPNNEPSDVTYSGFGWGFLEGFCLLE